MRLAKLPKLGKIELGLVGGITLVLGIMIYLILSIQGPAIRLTLVYAPILDQHTSSFNMKLCFMGDGIYQKVAFYNLNSTVAF